MSNAVTFFKLLFFLKTILLTPQPIDIDSNWIRVVPKEPLSAITGGAALFIDVSKYLEPYDWGAAEQLFPDGTVQVRLKREDGSELRLTNTGSSHSNDSVRLIVSASESMPTDEAFPELLLKSEKLIEAVNVYWQNGSK